MVKMTVSFKSKAPVTDNCKSSQQLFLGQKSACWPHIQHTPNPVNPTFRVIQSMPVVWQTYSNYKRREEFSKSP